MDKQSFQCFWWRQFWTLVSTLKLSQSNTATNKFLVKLQFLRKIRFGLYETSIKTAMHRNVPFESVCFCQNGFWCKNRAVLTGCTNLRLQSKLGSIFWISCDECTLYAGEFLLTIYVKTARARVSIHGIIQREPENATVALLLSTKSTLGMIASVSFCPKKVSTICANFFHTQKCYRRKIW